MDRPLYSIITVKEVEEDVDIQRIANLPQIGGLITLSPLLLPEQLQSDREVRAAAARLKADMVLLYTFDTSFHNNDASVALNVVTLGLSPTRKVFGRVAASALLIDTRTGFIYAALEANEKRQVISNAWESRESADRARRDAEKTAFKALVTEFEKNWPQIIERNRVPNHPAAGNAGIASRFAFALISTMAASRVSSRAERRRSMRD